MNILVVGNGFDIAHGLPTRYADYLAFLRAYVDHKNNALTDEEKQLFEEYFNGLKEDQSCVYSEIGTLSEKNIWLDYFMRIQAERAKAGYDSWVDFEGEISRVIQTLDAARHTFEGQFRSGNDVAKMEKWQRGILAPVFYDNDKYAVQNMSFDSTAVKQRKNQFLRDLNRLTRCLEIYLSSYISYQGREKLSDISILNIDRVLSFNYTHTFNAIYDTEPDSAIQYDYIHGKARIESDLDSCNLVLGIDEYLGGSEKDGDNEFIQFKKFYQRIYKMTGCHYTDWLNDRKEIIRRMPKLQKPELNVYIYGHSLDITDRDILRDLILSEGANTVIFYHSKEALGNQIANMVKVIGEEELIKRTDGNRRSIEFRKTSA